MEIVKGGAYRFVKGNVERLCIVISGARKNAGNMVNISWLGDYFKSWDTVKVDIDDAEKMAHLSCNTYTGVENLTEKIGQLDAKEMEELDRILCEIYDIGTEKENQALKILNDVLQSQLDRMIQHMAEPTKGVTKSGLEEDDIEYFPFKKIKEKE